MPASNGTPFLQALSIPAVLAAVVIAVVVSAFGVDLIGLALGERTHGALAVYGFAAVCTVLALWLILAAVFAYLNIGQAKKIENILGFYSPDTIADYFDQFWLGRDGLRDLTKRYRDAVDPAKAALATELESKLKNLFAADFGLGVFIVPIILLIGAGGIVLFLGFAGGIGLGSALSSGRPPPVQPFGLKLDLISIAGIFGAYTWVASDVIVRNHQWTLRPSDLGWYALRLIVAIPLGQALALMVSTANITAGAANLPAGTALPTGAGAFVAFVVSMFSLDAITTALGTAATRFGVRMQSSSEERDDLVVKLAGVDEERARALEVEGVGTIGQLVTVDPIRVSIRTGLPFEYILTLIDAALLWTFVGDKLKLLSPLGLRGACDVLELQDTWNSAAAKALSDLRQAYGAAAQARQVLGQAQAAIAAAGAAPTAAQQQALADAEAALTAAEAEVTSALVGFLADAGPGSDRAAMLDALTSVAAGAPGLTAIGFDTIAASLRKNSYAIFIKRLLEA